MADGEAPGRGDPTERLHSDVARRIDVDLLRSEVAGVGTRVGTLGDELRDYVIDHAQEHSTFAGDWERRFSGMAVDVAYRRGLIGLPRLVLEWLRQYLPTIATLLGLAVAGLGVATGAIEIRIGP